jgi:hypothetical protein
LKALKSVGGDLSINSNVELKAPKLESVGGDLYINSNVELKAPKLESGGGDLYINSNVELKALKSVGGDLYIYSNVELKAPKLESVGGDLYIYSNVELKALKSVGGYLSINSNVELKALKSVGGYLYINSNISHSLEVRLYKNNKNKKWQVNDEVSEWLLAQKGNFRYFIRNVEFSKELFDKVRKDKLSAQEIFAITNTEQRRIAYEKMDKIKMKDLKDYEVLDEIKNDGYGYSIKIISFKVDNFDEPFIYFNCFDPSTGREYFLQTQEKTCLKAKNKSFGFDEDIEWIKEW